MSIWYRYLVWVTITEDVTVGNLQIKGMHFSVLEFETIKMKARAELIPGRSILLYRWHVLYVLYVLNCEGNGKVLAGLMMGLITPVRVELS